MNNDPLLYLILKYRHFKSHQIFVQIIPIINIINLLLFRNKSNELCELWSDHGEGLVIKDNELWSDHGEGLVIKDKCQKLHRYLGLK